MYPTNVRNFFDNERNVEIFNEIYEFLMGSVDPERLDECDEEFQAAFNWFKLCIKRDIKALEHHRKAAEEERKRWNNQNAFLTTPPQPVEC